MAKQVYARPALLITHTRSGGTMLNYALSTHKRIFWTRGEPLLRQMEWGKAFPGAPDTNILNCITRASFYTVAGCKITYEQMTSHIWDWIQEKKPKILHLTRENMIRVIVSQMITGLVASQKLDHHAHSFDVLDIARVTVDPQILIARAQRQDRAIASMRKRMAEISGLSVLELTYDEITGGQNEIDEIPSEIAEQICNFLGVRLENLACDLRRVNRAPLSEIVENWEAVKKVISATEYRGMIEGD